MLAQAILGCTHTALLTAHPFLLGSQAAVDHLVCFLQGCVVAHDKWIWLGREGNPGGGLKAQRVRSARPHAKQKPHLGLESQPVRPGWIARAVTVNRHNRQLAHDALAFAARSTHQVTAYCGCAHPIVHMAYELNG